MLGTIGQVTSIFGTFFYEWKLKDMEVRTILFWSTICSIISSASSYAFAMRWNTLIGVPDMVFIIGTDTIFGVIGLAMNTLPTLALFAKVTPKKIEGTVFAFLTGTTNLANSVLSPMIGVYINDKFVGVNADDQSKYSKLCLISFWTSFLGFLILPLIPLKKDIQKYQDDRRERKRLAKQEEKMLADDLKNIPIKGKAHNLEELSDDEAMMEQTSKDSSGLHEEHYQGGTPDNEEMRNEDESKPLVQAK